MSQLDLFPGSLPPENQKEDLFGESAISLSLPIIKSFEGFRAKPYLDMVGVPTIGYGSTYYNDGKKVTLGDVSISEEEATNLLVSRIEKDFLPAVKNNCPGLQTLQQVAALISFTYNLGPAALAGSTLRRKIAAGDFVGAAEEFLKWDMAGGHEVEGLKRRRIAEKALFCST